MKYFILLLTFIAIVCENVVDSQGNDEDDDDDDSPKIFKLKASCSHHNSCGPYSSCDRGRCVCDPYFKIIDPRCILTCLSPCGIRGRCVVIAGRPRCICQYGFRKYEGRCYRYSCRNSCQENSSCRFYRQSFSCLCNPGYSGRKCKPNCSPKCKSESKCRMINGIPQCICLGRYTHETNENETCIRLCPRGYVRDFTDFRCKRRCRLSCGRYGRCVVTAHRPTCVCPDRFRLHRGICFPNNFYRH